MTGTTAAIIKQIEALGYAVSVHHMGDYIELHAVKLQGSDGYKLARSLDGDDEEQLYRTACLLAEAVGIDLA